MIRESQLVVRQVEDQDRTNLANLIHFGTYVHRHLDWRSPVGWIGHHPFHIIERNNKIIAALACPPEPPKIAWVRVFVCNSHFPQNKAWEILWPKTKSQLLNMGVEILAAIPLQKWVKGLLHEHGFDHTHNVISLAWDKQGIVENKDAPVNIREMNHDDLPQVLNVDSAAFDPLWQNSYSLLELAFESACIASVAVEDAEIIGYQISNPTQYGVHLGRLAVHPKAQQKGVGTALIRNLQSTFSKSYSGRISVNTQDTNKRSLFLYNKAGFKETNEAFPVFQYTF